MRRPRPLARSIQTFVEGPDSIRNAIRVIVAATVMATVVGGVLAWLLDRKDFDTLGSALWWSLQTVTTVGYGDVTPANPAGRIIGAVILLYAVAFLSILTATITTAFVEQASREQRRSEDLGSDAVLRRLDDIASRLERLEDDLRAGRAGEAEE